MATTTISLERSAYDLLRAQKLADESFSDEIHRLLGPHTAALKDFLTLLSAKEAGEVADRIEATRSADLQFELRASRRSGSQHGRRA